MAKGRDRDGGAVVRLLLRGFEGGPIGDSWAPQYDRPSDGPRTIDGRPTGRLYRAIEQTRARIEQQQSQPPRWPRPKGG